MLCRNANTFAQLAQPLGYVAKADFFHAVKAIVAAQRDYGRRHALPQCSVHGAVSQTVLTLHMCMPRLPLRRIDDNHLQISTCIRSHIAFGLAVSASCPCRDDRKYSRLKYLVHDWGMDKFRSVVQQYLGKAMEPFRCCPGEAGFAFWPWLWLHQASSPSVTSPCSICGRSPAHQRCPQQQGMPASHM